jgi:putative phosphoribosyl transferase
MLNQIKNRLQSRENAGRHLADRLLFYKHVNAIVLAIPRGGVPVGQQIAGTLNVPFDIIFSRRIKHPAHGDLSIGAVSIDEIVLQDSTELIPQSYIQQQVSSIQRALKAECQRYYENATQKSIRDKTVIIVDDVIREIDEVSACLHTIRKQEPEKIVVACAVANVKAVNFLIDEGIEFHYLLTEFHTQTKAYSYFPELSENETTELFKNTRQLSRY